LALFGAEENRKQEKIIENLREIEESYYHYLSRQERREAKKLMNETIRMIEEELEEKKESKNLMNEESYKVLYNEVKSKISDREKTGIISAATIRSKISSKQLMELLKLYTFDSYVEECIYKIYKNVYDKENFIIVISIIKSDFSKERVNKFIEESEDIE
jgi:hypothetical protein